MPKIVDWPFSWPWPHSPYDKAPSHEPPSAPSPASYPSWYPPATSSYPADKPYHAPPDLTVSSTDSLPSPETEHSIDYNTPYLLVNSNPSG